MCADPEGGETLRVFIKSYDGGYVESDMTPGGSDAFIHLYRSSYIDIMIKDNREYAVASPLGKQFKCRRGTVGKFQPSGRFARWKS